MYIQRRANEEKSLGRLTCRWLPGHWSSCSTPCESGVQNQTMYYCVETGVERDSVYVEEDLCHRYTDDAPVYERACVGDDVDCPYWASAAWSTVGPTKLLRIPIGFRVVL